MQAYLESAPTVVSSTLPVIEKVVRCPQCPEKADVGELQPGCPVSTVTHFIQRASARQHLTSLNMFLTETMMEQIMLVKEKISKICKTETVQMRRRNTFRYCVEKIRHGPVVPV